MKDALFGAILAIAVIVTGCTVNAKNSKYSQFQQEKAALSECDEYCYSSVMTVNGDKLAVTETIAKKDGKSVSIFTDAPDSGWYFIKLADGTVYSLNTSDKTYKICKPDEVPPESWFEVEIPKAEPKSVSSAHKDGCTTESVSFDFNYTVYTTTTYTFYDNEPNKAYFTGRPSDLYVVINDGLKNYLEDGTDSYETSGTEMIEYKADDSLFEIPDGFTKIE